MSAHSRLIIIQFVAVVASMLWLPPSALATRRYVDASSPGPVHDGTSWATAFQWATDGLSASVSGDEVWIADGVYISNNASVRSLSFQVPSGVRVYGGFSGAGVNETQLSQRNLALHRTIFSGEIGGPGIADNTLHVVVLTSVSATTVFDGICIVDGCANGTSTNAQGAGMRVTGSPTIRNCVFAGNSAIGNGGAVLCLGSPTFLNCVFTGNSALTGAAIDMQTSHLTMINCTVVGNTSSGSGIRLLNGDATPTRVVNCVLYNNTGTAATLLGKQISTSNAQMQVDTCCIQGLVGTLGGVGNIGAAPRFADPDGADNVVGTIDDDLRLLATSAGIDAGSNAAIPADANDLDSNGNTAEPLPFDAIGAGRLTDDIVNNIGPSIADTADMGAFEYIRSPAVICVNDTATGTNTGLTWANALNSLQETLEIAAVEGRPKVILVAQGMYHPSAPTGREATFSMLNDVRVFGGFDDSGTQGSLAQRRPDLFKTILSGDIGHPGDLSDNCYHVISADGTGFVGSQTPTLDGVVISAGFADGRDRDSQGGGALCFGGAKSIMLFRNCLFVGNDARGRGAGIDVGNSKVLMVNCVLTGNGSSAEIETVAVGDSGSLNLIHCDVVNNAARGVNVAEFSTIDIVNSMLHGNATGAFLSQLRGPAGGVALNRSLVQNLPPAFGGVGNINAAPAFADPDGADNLPGTADDDMHLRSCSAGIDAGDANALPSDADDLDDDALAGEALPFDAGYAARLFNDGDVVNTGTGSSPPDMGAFEFQSDSRHLCPADCAPTIAGNGQVNVSDLLQVITSWGVGPAAGDVSPPCGDGLVNVTDLLAVITAWGACP